MTDTTPNEEPCMVCLNPMQQEQDHLWSCSCCHHKCHMLCIMQWTLRLSLNNTRHAITSFTCPGCRTTHAITTLPGFESRTQTRSSTRRSTRTAATTPSTGNLLRRAFGLTSEVHVSGEGRGDTNDDDDSEYEGNSDDDDEEDEEDDNDDDSSSLLGDGRWGFHVSTEKIYIDVGRVTININTTTSSTESPST